MSDWTERPGFPINTVRVIPFHDDGRDYLEVPFTHPETGELWRSIWPRRAQFTLPLVAQAHQSGVSRDGDLISVTVPNSSAVYRVTHEVSGIAFAILEAAQ